MVVEIRSDGTKTMARGALEDLVTGQQVGIETEPMGILELSGQLTKSLLAIPGMAARQALRDRVEQRRGQLREVVPRRLVARPRVHAALVLLARELEDEA